MSFNFDSRHLMWGNPGDPEPNSRQEYLDSFCESFYEKMTNLIAHNVQEIDNLCSDTFVVEVVQHLDMCQKRYI